YDSKNPLTIWQNAAKLADLIRKENIAIVHARSRAPAFSAYLAARRTGAISVATYHGIYNAQNPIKRWYNGIMARGDAVIANCAYTGEHVKAQHRVDPKKLHVIPRGIDIAGFTPEKVAPDRVEAIVKQWGLKSGKSVIVLPGRLTRWKGQRVFIE